MDLSGTSLMEVQSNVLRLYHTSGLGLFWVVEQYVSTITLGLLQQESSTVRYLMPVETFRASMWGYILPPQVSPAHWRGMSLYSKSHYHTQTCVTSRSESILKYNLNKNISQAWWSSTINADLISYHNTQTMHVSLIATAFVTNLCTYVQAAYEVSSQCEAES